MSKYTTEVRFICENALGLTEQGDYSNVNNAIQSGRKKIFTFDYDLFDESYKSVIETKFLRHFYTREIGFETVALWKLKLEDSWLMKLPYYNELWKSALLEFNPLYDVDYLIDHDGNGSNNRTDNLTHTKTGTIDKDGSRTNEVNGTDKKTGNDKHGGTRDIDVNDTVTKTGDDTTHNEGSEDRNDNLIDKYSDTPQGELNGVIESDWLTNARQNLNIYHTEFNNDSKITYNSTTKDIRKDKITDDFTDTYDTTNTIYNKGIITDDFTDTFDLTDRDTGTVGILTTDKYLRKVVGKMGTKSYSELIREYRKTFINIDEMFINEMNDLFMLIY